MLRAALGAGGRKVGKIDREVARRISAEILQILLIQSELQKRQLNWTVPDDLQTLAIRMQQELPRAWAFKYGSGTTDFVRLEDHLLDALESCVVPGRAVGPRNSLFKKWNREAFGAARIATKWNAMSNDERRAIAPLAIGKVGAEAVKKLLQRDKRPGDTEP